MRSSLSVRRASYAALSAGLLAAVLVPLTASAATAVCPTYVDPEGDAAPIEPAVTGALQDDGLDLLAITHSTAGGVFSSTVKTVKLLESGSDNSFGDWFEARFTVVGKAVIVRVVRDANLTRTTTTRLTVDGVTAEAVPEAVYDFKAATVTLKVKQADLEKAVGAKLAGKPFSAMQTLAYGNYANRGLLFDDAVADEKASYVFGTACKGSATAKPAAAPAAVASPSSGASPTAAPSASASARPSGSASPSASASASASASPAGPPPAPQPTVPVPAAGCFGFEDPKGDARPGAQAPNDADLDILSVTGRTSSDALAGHLRIDKLAAKPALPVFSGHRFEYQFTVGDKVVLLRASAEGVGTGLVGGVAAPDLKVTAAFDTVSSQVVLSVTRDSLATVLGRELPDGTFLEAQTGRSAALSPGLAFAADTATTDDASRARYTVGDNTCFAPRLSVSLPGEVQTGDGAVITVALTTSDGRVPAGQTVTAQVGSGRMVSAKTDAQGSATLVAPVRDEAGPRQLVVRSSGSAGKGELAGSLRVVAERTLLRVVAGGAGTVTATLTDDDEPRRALAGQRLVFRFDGRTLTGTTNESGRAVVRVPTGSVVEVSFAGRRGHLSATAATVTAR